MQPGITITLMRILIAGVGNVLRGDDGFGVEVAKALTQRNNLPAGVAIFEGGIAGIPLVQELMDGYDALIVADALDRGGVPGSIYVFEPDITDPATLAPFVLHASLADAHYTEPSKVLILAKALGVLPRTVFVVGCQPAGFDELGAALSDEVSAALPVALDKIELIIANLNDQEMK